MPDRIKIIGAFSVALVCLLFIAKGFLPIAKDLLPPSTPKYVAVINYDQLQSVDQNPCVVLFYHSSSDESVRKLMPAFDKVASLYKDKLQFFRYHLSDPEQYMPQKSGAENTFTIYDGGKEIRNFPNVGYSDDPEADEGLIMVLMKDYVLAGHPDQTGPAGAAFVTAADFQRCVLDSSRPVIVDFTSAICPPCRTLEPQFKQLASQYSKIADFYFFDHQSPANYSIVHQYSVSATPTVMLFVNGQPHGRYSGAYGSSELNEGRILLLLQPYL